MAIPEDLREAADVYKLPRLRRWRFLVLPAIFHPVTGDDHGDRGRLERPVCVEYVTFGGHTYTTVGWGDQPPPARRGEVRVLLAAP